MRLLTKEQHESYEIIKKRKILQRKIFKERFENKYVKDKKYLKVRDHYHHTGKHRGPAHIIYKLAYSVPKKISIAFHNESNYHYQFIIKDLAKEFEKQLPCLGESTEKSMTFTVPIEKEVTRIGKHYKKYILKITIY